MQNIKIQMFVISKIVILHFILNIIIMISQTLKSIGYIKCSSFSTCVNFNKNYNSFHMDCLSPLEFAQKKFIISQLPKDGSFSNKLQQNNFYLQNIDNKTEINKNMSLALNKSTNDSQLRPNDFLIEKIFKYNKELD